jgi:Family of unknown function (DUF6186)
MSSHTVTLAGYLLVLALGTGLNALAHRPASRLPTLAAVCTRIMHSRTGKIAVIAWWAWFGVHLFSK